MLSGEGRVRAVSAREVRVLAGLPWVRACVHLPVVDCEVVCLALLEGRSRADTAAVSGDGRGAAGDSATCPSRPRLFPTPAFCHSLSVRPAQPFPQPRACAGLAVCLLSSVRAPTVCFRPYLSTKLREDHVDFLFAVPSPCVFHT